MLLMWVVLALSAEGRVHLTDTDPSYAMRERTSGGGTRSNIQAGGAITLDAPKRRNQNSTISSHSGVTIGGSLDPSGSGWLSLGDFIEHSEDKLGLRLRTLEEDFDDLSLTDADAQAYFNYAINDLAGEEFIDIEENVAIGSYIAGAGFMGADVEEIHPQTRLRQRRPSPCLLVPHRRHGP